MKIIITGGAGFIGSHLCNLFLEKGHVVVCIDNLISGKKENIKHILDNKNFSFLEKDIINEDFDLADIDAIFHFASPASPNPDSPVSYINNPIETLMVNSIGTKKMLDLARANNCQIILASTSEVYGDPLEHPQKEEYWGNVSPNGPRSCYDEAKRFLEAISYTYYRKFNTKIKVIRIFNTYGPNMRLDEGRFIPSLFNSYLNDTPFKLFASQETTRSFCYIDDLVSGIEKVFETNEMVGEVVNLGNPDEFKITEVIKVFEQMVGSELNVINYDELGDDPKRRKPDISKAKNLLNWSPNIDIKNGLKLMLEFYGK